MSTYMPANAQCLILITYEYFIFYGKKDSEDNIKLRILGWETTWFIWAGLMI